MYVKSNFMELKHLYKWAGFSNKKSQDLKIFLFIIHSTMIKTSMVGKLTTYDAVIVIKLLR